MVERQHPLRVDEAYQYLPPIAVWRLSQVGYVAERVYFLLSYLLFLGIVW